MSTSRSKPVFADGSYLEVDENNKLSYFDNAGVKRFSLDPATGKITLYGNLASAGFGIGEVVALAKVTGKTATQTNFLNFTPPSVEAYYLLLVVVIVNSVTGGSVQVSSVHTDRGTTSRTITLASRTTTGEFNETPAPFSTDNSGTAITATATAAATINFDAIAVLIRVG